jgi:hypothetical protein
VESAFGSDPSQCVQDRAASAAFLGDLIPLGRGEAERASPQFSFLIRWAKAVLRYHITKEEVSTKRNKRTRPTEAGATARGLGIFRARDSVAAVVTMTQRSPSLESEKFRSGPGREFFTERRRRSVHD